MSLSNFLKIIQTSTLKGWYP